MTADATHSRARCDVARGLRQLALSAPLLLVAAAAAGQSASLVRDLAPGDLERAEVAPNGLLTAGHRVFFFGNLGSADLLVQGLWVSDGTASGTQALAQVCAGDCTNRYLGTVGPLLFFLGGTDNGDHLLWRSDGTRAGTFPLNVSGPQLSSIFNRIFLIDQPHYASVKSTFYFAGCPNFICDQLWRTDGSAAGTSLLVQLPAPVFSGDPGLSSLTSFGGRLYFINARGSDGSPALWRSDGTSSGTSPFSAATGPHLLTAAGSRLFFAAANDPQSSTQLWVTDGTAAPHPFTRFASSLAFGDTQWLKPEGDRVYFIADDGSHGQQIWVGDGTAAGTVPVTGFTNPQPFAFDPIVVGPIGPNQVELLGNRLVFFATDGQSPPGLWASSGSPGSTVPLCPGSCGPLTQNTPLVKVGGRVTFFTGSFDAGFALWSSDGTAAGTILLDQACGPSCVVAPSLQVVGAKVYFQAVDGAAGLVLWQSDGTAAGTKPYAHDLVSAATSSLSPVEVAGLGNLLLFDAADKGGGLELWASDGTTPGTRQLTDAGGSNSASPGGFVSLGSLVFFSAFTSPDAPPSLWQSAGTAATTVPVPGVTGFAVPLLATAGSVFFTLGGQLWRADGSAAGTRQLTSFQAGQTVGPQAVPFQGQLFFVVPSESGSSLWKSDGAVQGTSKVFDLPALPFPVRFDRLWAAGGLLFFTTIDSDVFVSHLWRSDATAAGTFALATVPYDVDPEVTAAGGWVYFIATQAVGDAELWRTDGSLAGTGPFMAGSQGVGGQGSKLTALRELGGVLYLFVTDGAESVLWRTDGTAAGTLAVRRFPIMRTSFFPPAALTVLGRQLLFPLDDGDHGIEPWTSDGTAAGTALLRDINQGPPGSSPSGLTVAGGKVFFDADDGIHGPELWESDGTTAGTRLVQDVWPGPAGANPSGMIQAGDRLFFAANDGLTGNELWALPLTGATACQPEPTALCLLGARFKVDAFWRDFQGNSGQGQAVALTPDTGYFWFFNPDNVEAVAKVIDGRPVDSHFWFFYGALSSVEYSLTVTDTATGAARRYYNPPGQLASVGDTTAFGPQGALSIVPPAAAPARAAPAEAAAAGSGAAAAGTTGPCQPGPQRLCLDGGRFAVTVSWQDFTGRTGTGTAVDLSADTGTFWFFSAANVELVLKVLDGRAVNGKFWLFYGALSNVAYTIEVQDTVTGKLRTYTNPAGQFASVADTSAF